MSPRGLLLLVVASLAILAAGTASAAGLAASSAASHFCDRTTPFTAGQQDRLLRFAAVVRDELERTRGSAALISRSGLDLSRFRIRYSHAAVAWRSEAGAWTARQLYYACDEGRPRLYDQGVAGFAMGIDNPSHGYVSIVRLPTDAANTLRLATLDTPRALRLLAANYSANAYPFSTRYQNCNQWVVELLASAWGDLSEGADLRERAQHWLRQADYAPEPVDVDSPVLMFASTFVPLVHLDDHPEEDVFSMKLEISLPLTVEAFIRQRLPDSERIELCYDAKRVVVHHGWEPIADGCEPTEGDRVVSLE
ncbi:DUF2145 domain-containing protein [Ralstonia solanacearum]|uniref:DUF2145 domain-containing protein n=1 Tax=Ralstonia solanacearum TaxID=305 RepID=UPI00044B0F8A|nr:DUF2145 domain-containing protein [Ralstonia solanacearum]EUJ15070.1 signal peptide protein [Ralstonia solanacearum P673]MCL9846904.1 DUF2145 domain-containing protein [Ralstonia solanacearum]MCL9848143.1 DUF2145 domain-containing protein [Ralstonia solanacearum]MCL9854579.1 DUF2145 domain-containing protein [Ralstonia solanacearum]MCL9859877.1 DUF2145 domain-containing protein [Ralstonia solanacearum]